MNELDQTDTATTTPDAPPGKSRAPLLMWLGFAVGLGLLVVLNMN